MEIGTDDQTVNRDFFAAVFDWAWKGESTQGWFENNHGPIGLHGDDTPMDDTPMIVPYFPVTDINAAMVRVLDSGSTIMGDINQEEGFGAFVTCADPRGVRFGLHET